MEGVWGERGGDLEMRSVVIQFSLFLQKGGVIAVSAIHQSDLFTCESRVS